MGERVLLGALEAFLRVVWGDNDSPPAAPVPAALRAEMDAVWAISGELARQLWAQWGNRRISFALEPRYQARDAGALAFAESALRETLIARGIEIHEGLTTPRRVAGVRAAYIPMLKRIELGPGYDMATRLALLAHEGAHALTVHTIRNEALAEVVAETTMQLVTAPYIRPLNADSHLYIALYAAMTGMDLDETWQRAAPHAAQATTAIREGIAASSLPLAA